MDGLLSAALQEVAVEGTQGCTLQKLWATLQSAAGIAAETISNRRAKQLLWLALINVPGMLLSLPNSAAVANTDSRIHDVDDAEKLGVQLVAPESLRESSLGMYDLRVCDARLSKEQRNVLECIAKSRSKGITQSHLAKEFKIPGNKMFYLVKMLEVRGLVVRQATLVRTVDGNSEGNRHVPIVATNLLHLTRYAKDLTLSSHQRFEIFSPSKDNARDVPKSVRDNIDDEDPVPNEREFIIKDDLPAMQTVCQKLEETDGKVLVVSDLKTTLGYRLAVGHRTWRRLVKRLQDAGLVEILSAQIENKVRACIRLVKSFDSRAFKATNDEQENEPPLKCGKRGQVTDLVTELPIDQQIYDLVDRSGIEGVQMIEVFNSLGLQNKRNYYRISTMLERGLLVSEAENHKRSTLYRLKTARNVSGFAKHPGVQSYEEPKVTPYAETFPPQDSGFHEACEVITPSQSSSLNDGSAPEKGAKESARRTLQQARLQKGKSKESESVQVQMETIQEQLPQIEMKVEPEWTDINAIVPFSNPKNPILQAESPLPISFIPREFTELDTPLSSNIPMSTTRAQREKRILEKLQAEKFLLRVELHRWLEEVENRKNIMMDRKTLSRMLQGLQASGHCKCVMLSMPGLTNCGRQRTIEVVLLPSLVIDPELLSKVHEQVRKFDMMSRGHGVSRVKAKDSVPVLTGVPRMNTGQVRRITKFDSQNDNSRSMQANGFIPAKMVRVRLLHYFLWGYVNSLPEDRGYQPDGSGDVVGSCKIFGLANAVQTMPLELFLQVVGSFHKIENVGEWCKQGLCLNDLPKEDVMILLDSNATGRLSWLVDVLRRLKLVRLVMGCGSPTPLDPDDVGKSSLSAVLTYAMEREPYLEEPAPHPLPSMNLDMYDLSPRARHEFSIFNKDGLDAYWQNLEYFYSGAQPVVARCAFPGTNVPELFGLRSWATLKVMTLEQRTELIKRVSDGGMEKRRPWHECVKIAKELNLSLQQVLRVSYEKNRVYRLQTLQKAGQTFRKRHMFSVDFGEPSHVKAYKKQRREHDGAEKEVGSGNVQPDMPVVDDNRKLHEDEDYADDDDDDDNEGLSIGGQPMHDFSFVGSIKPSRPRARRFQWSEHLDRLLITAYVRQRAQLGALYHRVDWYVMTGLPASPLACRRRMAQLRLDLGVRKAVMSLCSLLTLRYIHHTQSQGSTSAVGDPPSSVLSLEGASVADRQYETSDCEDGPRGSRLGVYNDSNVQPDVNAGLAGTNSGLEYSWDDMREPFLAAALDEVIRCRAAVKANSTARGAASRSKLSRGPNPDALAVTNSKISHSVGKAGVSTLSEASVPSEANVTKNLEAIAAAGASFSQVSALSRLTVNPLTPFSQNASLLDEETAQRAYGQLPGRALAAAGPTRRVRKHNSSTLKSSTGVSPITNEQLVRNSVAVANAVELVKLILLNSGEEAQLSGTLVEAVQRFKEAEVFTAVKYLRERGFLVAGQGGQTFVLSPKFFHDCSVSRFPVQTGNECLITEQWFNAHSKEIEQDWVNLPSEPQSGQLSHLLAMVSSNDFSLNPVLPATDLGEAEENNSGKRKSSTNELREVLRNVKARTRSQICSELRRERGFPGIEVSLIRSRTSLATVLDNFGCRSGDRHERTVAEPVTSEAMPKVDGVVDLTEATSPHPELHNDRLVAGMGEALGGTVSIFTGLNSLPDLSYGGHDWGPNPKKDEQNHSVGFVACPKATRASGRKSTLDDCVRHWSSDSMEKSDGVTKPPHLTPDLLKTAFSAVEQAGEEGLPLETLAKYLQLAGMDVSNELETVGSYVQALESFGLIKRVNAYDHIRTVEASKCSRFYLHVSHEDDFENSQQSSSRDMPDSGEQLACIRSMGTVVGECGGFSESHGRKPIFDAELVGKSPDLAASQLLIGSSTTTSIVTAKAGDHRIISLKPDGCRDVKTEHVAIVPWLNQSGAVNKPMLKGLIRRVMGIITIHPGISEDTLLEQIKVLNPQSVRQLIQILELDGHLVVRSLPGPAGAAPPRLLRTLTGHTKPCNTRSLKHYFVNPLAGRFL